MLPPEALREQAVPRLKMRTLKRHFSALSQFWIYIGRQGLVARDANLFLRWQYQGVRRNAKKKRLPWSVANLDKLFASNWFGATEAGNDYWWTVLLPVQIIGPTGGDVKPIACFEIQVHPDPNPWNPKTEAGARRVPVHSFLLSLGFMDFVDKRRLEGSYTPST